MVFLMGVPGKLKTLLDRLTATRAGYLDRLDATISSRAPSSTALSTATWTATKAGYLDQAISTAAKHAKFIATGYVQAARDGASGTAEDSSYKNVTVAGVTDYTNCVVMLSGMRYESATVAQDTGTGYPVTARMTSNTNMRLGSRYGSALSFVGRYYIWELERTS